MSEQPEVSPTTGRVDDAGADMPSGALKQAYAQAIVNVDGY